ncbi:MAG TPA: pyridoxamine 5'-phosphate oxidase family protein [Candidatus Acidoferrum sp.]|nr:pyridoxamine 5'-phosphate oxidase family protein [Candidatus Acidoferrum sp.]
MPYSGQPPALTTEEIESLLNENSTARICTHNKDGTIHAAPVSYRYINGQIVVGSIAPSRKTRNIKRNNNVTVLIDNEKAQGILIYGKAKVEYDNIYQTALLVWEKAIHAPRDRLERFVRAYLDAVEYVIIRITPQHTATFDAMKDGVWINLVKTYLQE